MTSSDALARLVSIVITAAAFFRSLRQQAFPPVRTSWRCAQRISCESPPIVGRCGNNSPFPAVPGRPGRCPASVMRASFGSGRRVKTENTRHLARVQPRHFVHQIRRFATLEIRSSSALSGETPSCSTAAFVHAGLIKAADLLIDCRSLLMLAESSRMPRKISWFRWNSSSKRAPTALVCWNRIILQPAPASVLVEIGAGIYGTIDRAQIQAAGLSKNRQAWQETQ